MGLTWTPKGAFSSISTPLDNIRSSSRWPASVRRSTTDLEAFLAARHVAYVVQKAQGTAWTARKQQLEAVERWYVHVWSKLDARLRSSIVEGVVVFLSLFDDSSAVHRAFCPPRRAYTEEPAQGEPRPRHPSAHYSRAVTCWPSTFPSG